jgi:PKD repeat protein
LTANNVCGSQTVTAQVTIILPPVPVIGVSPTTGCAPLTVSYTASPQVAGQSYQWNFPGGTPAFSLLPDPSVVYSTPGVYGASLTIINAAGPGSITENALVDVITVPSVAFTYQYTPGSLTVSFQNGSTGATSYVWTFGDGEESGQEHPVHQFPGAGIYTVTLRAINACGFTETSLPIEIILPPTASFTAVPNTGCAPHTVQYMAMPSGSAYTYAWTFPGGNPSVSTEANPQVNYALAGIYGATLVVTNIAGSDSVETSDAVEVITLPVAAFAVNSTAGSLEISLLNQSSGATAYIWDFGDGQTSDAVNPVHTYATDGDYVITLRAINACGEETTQRLVNLFLPPLPGIIISDTLGCMPMTVVYRASPQRAGHTYAWNFPGGQPTNSTDSVVSVTYNQVGQYGASLEVTNPAGSNIQQLQDMVRVITTPTAVFTINDTPGSLQVSLTNNSAGAERFEWIFSDGGSAELPEPVYSFPLPGMYTVTLRAINQCGVDTLSATISVDTPLPIPLFSVVGGQGCAPLAVQFTNQTIAGDSYQWTFPGGTPSSSTDTNPIVTYTTPGVYDVTLLATNVAGNAAITRVQVVRVLGLPEPDFSVAIATDTVRFTNQSIGGQNYAWQFGDGGSQTLESPIWIYGSPGTYRVELRVTNACGSTETEQLITLSGALPEADFTVDTLIGCAPLTVTYTDRTPGDVRFREWLFDGGSPETGSEETIMITYNTPGEYSVSLVVGNFYGRDTLTRSEYLLVNDEPEIVETQVVSARPDEPAWLSYTFNATATGIGLQYVWIIEGVDTLEGPNQDYVFPGPGVYVVRLEVTNACGTASVQAGIVDILISGTREVLDDIPWQVYPNPGYGQYRISLEGKQTFRVLDVLGRLVWRGTVDGPVAVLDITDKPSGVYWVVDDKGRYVKLIKK